ncbi:MAG: hypothetical protein ACRD29_16025 [Acidimicrobiales bacterium]
MIAQRRGAHDNGGRNYGASMAGKPRKLLPARAPLVLPADRPHMRAFNDFARAATRIDLAMLPERSVGNLAAPLLVLNLNPEIGGDPDRRWHRRRMLRQAALASLLQRPVHYPL